MNLSLSTTPQSVHPTGPQSAEQLALQLQRAEELSALRIDPNNAQSLLAAARALAPHSQYLGGILAGGLSWGLLARFQQEVKLTAAQWRSEWCAFRNHNVSQNYERWSNSFYHQSPEEQREQEREQAAEAVMRRLRTLSPQTAERAMNESLNREVGLSEVENSLRRSSLFFATSTSDRLSLLSNFVASATSGYVSAARARSGFSVHNLAFTAFAGALNGAVQCFVQMAPQVGDMSSEQLQARAIPLIWQALKSVGIGAFSGVCEYGGGLLFKRLGIQNPFARAVIGLIFFCGTDVGGEVFATHCLTQLGVALGVEAERILEASGRYSFLANFIDEVGGKIPNHFSSVNLMNVGAVGAWAANSPINPIHLMAAAAGLGTFLMPQLSQAVTLHSAPSGASHFLEFGVGTLFFGNVILMGARRLVSVFQQNTREIKAPNIRTSSLENPPCYYNPNLSPRQVQFIQDQFKERPYLFSKVALSEENNEIYLRHLHEAAEGQIDFTQLILNLFECLQKDFVELAKKEGAKVSTVSLKEFLELRNATAEENPAWLENAIRENERLGRERVTFVERSTFDLSKNTFTDSLNILRDVSFAFEKAAGFPQGSFFESSKTGMSPREMFVFMPASFYLKLVEDYAGKPIAFIPEARDLDLSDIEEMHGNAERPFQLWRYVKKIHLEESHPFAQAKHDIFHYLWMVVLSAETRRDCHKLYNAYNRLPMRIRSKFPQELPAGLMECLGYVNWEDMGNFQFNSTFMALFGAIKKNPRYNSKFALYFAESFRVCLSQEFSDDLAKRDKVLEALDQAIQSSHL